MRILLTLTIFLCAGMGYAETPVPVTEALPDPLVAGWLGKPVCEKLHEDQLQRILRCTFPPNIGHEQHFHPKHFGYALSGGTMRITDAKGTRDATLKTGSYFSSNGTPWHEVLNIGNSTVIYLMIEPKT